MTEKRFGAKNTELHPAVKSLVDEIKTINQYYNPDRTQSIRDILKTKGTNCWGVSRIALNRLRKAGLDPETVYIYEDGVPMKPTHQFTTFRDGDNYRIHDYWFNPNREQISKPYKTREEAIDDRVKEWRTAERHFTPVDVYTGTKLPNLGYTHEDYMGAMRALNKHLKTYPKMEKRSSYEDALSVFKSLPPKSQQYLSFTPGEYHDPKDYLLYRVVKKSKGDPVGFVDIYKQDNDDKAGFVVIGVKPEHQRKGVGRSLLSKAISEGKKRKLESLTYGCMNDNTASRKLAKSFGGKKFNEIAGYEMYTIPLKSNNSTPSKITAESIHKAARIKRSATEVPRLKRVLLGALGGGVTGLLPGAAIGSVTGLGMDRGPLQAAGWGSLIGSGVGALAGGLSELTDSDDIRNAVNSVMPLKARMARSGDILAREDNTSLSDDQEELEETLRNYDKPSNVLLRGLGYGLSGALPGAAMGALATPFFERKDKGAPIGGGALAGAVLGGLYGILKKPGRGKGFKDTAIDALMPINGTFARHMRTNDDKEQSSSYVL